jgi:phosphoribosylformimino-5-aminoimidazole carboxamide ribotide isomerase
MQIIPVIDIRHGAVVRAVAGQRDQYAPIKTALAPSSAPLDVALGLASLHSFDALYIADLDAIEGRGENLGVIRQIRNALPHIDLWVDAGLKGWAAATSMREMQIAPVLGSESCRDASMAPAICGDPSAILSLDFLGERFLGDSRLQHCDALWPQRLIVMTLSRVGAGAGPDVARIREFVARAQGRRIYAAGGVRGVDDLDALSAAGAAGALVATALHDGRLTPEDLKRIAQR